jgi:P22_AR N-terminal domain
MDSIGEPAPGGAITPLREQIVEFYGDAIPVAQTADGGVYVPVRPLTDFLGLDFSAQRQRINRDDVLVEQARLVVMARSDGRRVEMLCLPLDLLPGWLFGVQPSRARPELAAKLRRYRLECFRVLWRAFKGDVMPAAPPPADLDQAEQALMLAEAVASLARSHLEQTGRIEALEHKQQTMADYLRPFVQRTNERLTALELRLSSGATISEDQATEIGLAVKNVAMLLVQRGEVNGFGRVWGELYRRYRVGAYRNLPAARYEEVLAWLRSWFEELDKGNDRLAGGPS